MKKNVGKDHSTQLKIHLKERNYIGQKCVNEIYNFEFSKMN